jgi:hypothetical protein
LLDTLGIDVGVLLVISLRVELSNVYYHCDGCESLLYKDFNICDDCFFERKYKSFVPMNLSNPKRSAAMNHLGEFVLTNYAPAYQFPLTLFNLRISEGDVNLGGKQRCKCRKGQCCDQNLCRCHTSFSVHLRLFLLEREEALLQKVENIALEDCDVDSIARLKEQLSTAQNRLLHAKESLV